MSEQTQTNVCTVRIPSELRDRIDEARGGVPRERFVRELLELALKDSHFRHAAQVEIQRAPSSAEARGNVRPVPKAGK